MGALGEMFNPSEVERQSFVLLEPGTYRAKVSDTEIVENDKGKACWVTFTIVGGDFNGTTIREFCCYGYKDEKARNTGRSKFAEICEATHAGIIQDSNELLHKHCMIDVVKGSGYIGKDGQTKENRNIRRCWAIPKSSNHSARVNTTPDTVVQPAPIQQSTPVEMTNYDVRPPFMGGSVDTAEEPLPF